MERVKKTCPAAADMVVIPDADATPIAIPQTDRRSSAVKRQRLATEERMAQSGSLRTSAHANDGEDNGINADWLAFWRKVRALAAEHDRAEEQGAEEVDL